MSQTLTINAALISPQANKPLAPAMVTALWVIADQIDRKGIKQAKDDAVWLEMPSKLLRGEGGRDDNVWLRECLDRLTGLKLTGEYKGDTWGAVILAEWRIIQGGSVVRLLVPPAAINVLRAPETFAKVEAMAAYKLDGHARRLYAALADKKRMRQTFWVYGVDELRALLGVENKKSYERFNNLRQWVLAPAIEQINDFGTVKISMTPEKVGRAVAAIRFDWQWKTIDEARETDEENDRPDIARRKVQEVADAPPMMPRKDDFAERLAVIITAKERTAGRNLTKDEKADEADRLRDLMTRERATFAERTMREAGLTP